MHQPVACISSTAVILASLRRSAGMAVVLGPVSVADYLQRETFLQRQADGSLSAATDGRWAGSLSSDIDQLLVRQLAWRLDSQRVVLAPASRLHPGRAGAADHHPPGLGQEPAGDPGCAMACTGPSWPGA
jgi:hypothetical protein